MSMILPPNDQIDFDKGCPIVFSNVVVKFCSLITPDDRGKYGPAYKIAFTIPNEDAAWLESVGKKVEDELAKDAAGNKIPTGKKMLWLDSKVYSFKGEIQKPPRYTYADGRTAFPVECGRGSIVNVATVLKRVDRGFPLYLNAVQVLFYKEIAAGGASLVDYTTNPAELPAQPDGTVLAVPGSIEVHVAQPQPQVAQPQPQVAQPQPQVAQPQVAQPQVAQPQPQVAQPQPQVAQPQVAQPQVAQPQPQVAQPQPQVIPQVVPLASQTVDDDVPF